MSVFYKNRYYYDNCALIYYQHCSPRNRVTVWCFWGIFYFFALCDTVYIDYMHIFMSLLYTHARTYLYCARKSTLVCAMECVFLNLPCCCVSNIDDVHRCGVCGSLNDDVVAVQPDFLNSIVVCASCAQPASSFTYPCLCRNLCASCALEYYDTHSRCSACGDTVENHYDIPAL